MDARIQIGNKLDLEKIDKSITIAGKRQVYISKVLDVNENQSENLYVSMPVQEGHIVPLSVGQEFYATFYTKSGLLQSHVVVVGRYKKGNLFLMEIQLLSSLEKVQRREFFRFDCRIPMSYRILSKEEQIMIENEEMYEISDMQLEWKTAAMLDLSGGGMCFVTANRENHNIYVQVKFELLMSDQPTTIYAFADLLRCEQNRNNNAIYDCHLKFWRMNNTVREQIVRFIFDEQRKQRSKESGMK